MTSVILTKRAGVFRLATDHTSITTFGLILTGLNVVQEQIMVREIMENFSELTLSKR